MRHCLMLLSKLLSQNETSQSWSRPTFSKAFSSAFHFAMVRSFKMSQKISFSFEGSLLIFYTFRSILIYAVLAYVLLICSEDEPLKVLPFQLYTIISFFGSVKAVIGFKIVSQKPTKLGQIHFLFFTAFTWTSFMVSSRQHLLCLLLYHRHLLPFCKNRNFIAWRKKYLGLRLNFNPLRF